MRGLCRGRGPGLGHEPKGPGPPDGDQLVGGRDQGQASSSGSVDQSQSGGGRDGPGVGSITGHGKGIRVSKRN